MAEELKIGSEVEIRTRGYSTFSVIDGQTKSCWKVGNRLFYKEGRLSFSKMTYYERGGESGLIYLLTPERKQEVAETKEKDILVANIRKVVLPYEFNYYTLDELRAISQIIDQHNSKKEEAKG